MLCALPRGDFALWFLEQALAPFFLSQPSDVGLDQMCCGAAQSFLPDVPPCYLVPLVFLHDDTRHLAVHDPDIDRQVMEDFRKNDVYRAWMDASIAFLRLVEVNIHELNAAKKKRAAGKRGSTISIS